MPISITHKPKNLLKSLCVMSSIKFLARNMAVQPAIQPNMTHYIESYDTQMDQKVCMHAPSPFPTTHY